MHRCIRAWLRMVTQQQQRATCAVYYLRFLSLRHTGRHVSLSVALATAELRYSRFFQTMTLRGKQGKKGFIWQTVVLVVRNKV